MSSLRELETAKLLKRADLPKIRLEQIHTEPGDGQGQGQEQGDGNGSSGGACRSPAPTPAPNDAKANGYTDSQRLEFMLQNRAIVVRSNSGFSVCTVGTGTERNYSTSTSVEALDAFMVEMGIAA